MNNIQRSKIESFLKQCVDEGVFPGANVVVYETGIPSYFSVGNKRLIPNIEKNSLSTIYDIASLTKVVVTVNLIMLAIEENKLSLDTPIASILSSMKHKDITVFDLCTHTSGLPADTKMSLEEDKESIRKKVYACDKTYEKGTDVIYSDIGFIILGFLLEEVYQMPLDKLAFQKIFKPLDMVDTMYCPDTKRRKRCAPTEDSPHFHKILCGEVHDRKAHMMNGVSGHAGVFTSIEDISHITQMLLKKGLYRGKRFLSEESVAAFSKAVTPKGKIARSIGYLHKDERSPFAKQSSELAYLHTGFAGTSILIDPAFDLGIVILSNRIHPTRENTKILDARTNIHTKIIEILFES